METIDAVVTDTGSGTVRAGTESVVVSPPGDVAAARQAVLRAAEDAVRERGQVCRLVITDMGTRHVFALHPDGSREAIADEADVAPEEEPVLIVDVPAATAIAEPPAPAVAIEEPPTAAEYLAQPASAEAGVTASNWAREHQAVAPAPVEIPPRPTVPAPEAAAAPLSRRDARATRQSFLQAPEVEQPATKGARALGRFLGLHLPPSEEERAERSDRRIAGQHFPGPRTIAVVNGKGGASKTPTTINLAAVLALYGGSGVLAWDNNQTRGTLGWRTEQGPHEATLLDLLDNAQHLLGPNAQAADLHRFVHHQTDDLFDVLRSKPKALGSEQRITPEEVSLIHSVATKYYRMVIMDSGNDESDPLWRQMILHTDQLVLPVTTREDNREAGALLLEDLAELDERSARLADEAVVIVSQAEPAATAADVARVVAEFKPFVREVVTIPYDPALVAGVIRHKALRPATQRAWLRAAAAVASGL